LTPNTRTLKGQSYCSQRWANPVWPKGSKSRGFSSSVFHPSTGACFYVQEPRQKGGNECKEEAQRLAASRQPYLRTGKTTAVDRTANALRDSEKWPGKYNRPGEVRI